MPKEPILFSRLGSTSQVTTSVVGASGSEAAGANYAAGKYGNGLNSNGVTAYVSYPTTTAYSGNAGCIESWIKPVGFSITNGSTSADYRWVYSLTADANNWIDLILGATGFLPRIKSATAFGGFGSTYQTHASFDVADGENFHLATVWNTAGIAGGSDIVRVYFNNLLIANTTTAAPAPVGSCVLDVGIYAQGYSNPLGGVVDNLKIYNYAKTDFSDRLNERGGMNDQVIVL